MSTAPRQSHGFRQLTNEVRCFCQIDPNALPILATKFLLFGPVTLAVSVLDQTSFLTQMIDDRFPGPHIFAGASTMICLPDSIHAAVPNKQRATVLVDMVEVDLVLAQ